MQTNSLPISVSSWKLGEDNLVFKNSLDKQPFQKVTFSQPSENRWNNDFKSIFDNRNYIQTSLDSSIKTKNTTNIVSEQNPLILEKIQKRRLYTQKWRDKKKLEKQALNEEFKILKEQQSKMIELGQKVEILIAAFRSQCPFTKVPSFETFQHDSQISPQALEDKNQQVEIYQRRIEQILDVITREFMYLNIEREVNIEIYKNLLGRFKVI